MNPDALRLILFAIGTNMKKRNCAILRRCPPCRSFSPKLIEFYNTCKEADEGSVEIVFVSSDRNAAEFEGYFEKFPWLSTVPGFTSDVHRDRQGKLAETFKIQVW